MPRHKTGGAIYHPKQRGKKDRQDLVWSHSVLRWRR